MFNYVCPFCGGPAFEIDSGCDGREFICEVCHMVFGLLNLEFAK